MSKKTSVAKLARKNTKQQTKIAKKQGEKIELANHEVVVLAAFLAGAQTNPADTEDITVQRTSSRRERAYSRYRYNRPHQGS